MSHAWDRLIDIYTKQPTAMSDDKSYIGEMSCKPRRPRSTQRYNYESYAVAEPIKHPNRWFVHHAQLEYSYYPGQEVTIAPGIDIEKIKDEPRANPVARQYLKSLRGDDKGGIPHYAKIDKVWIDTDGQLMVQIKDAYIPAQYLTPRVEKETEEFKTEEELLIEGIAMSLNGDKDDC